MYNIVKNINPKIPDIDNKIAETLDLIEQEK
jgi:hypothetical protein